MRRLTIGAFQSLDGVMQAPGGPEEDRSGEFRFGGWIVPHFDDAVGAFVGAMFGGEFDLLLGRRTYDIFAAHWPSSDEEPLASKLNRAAKYVLTTSSNPLGWNNSHVLGGIDAVARVKASGGPDLIVQGSHTIHGPLLASGLVDRLFLLTFPVVLGQGKRLFAGGAGPSGFRLVEGRISPSGVLMAVYERAGEVRTGSFAHTSEPAA